MFIKYFINLPLNTNFTGLEVTKCVPAFISLIINFCKIIPSRLFQIGQSAIQLP